MHNHWVKSLISPSPTHCLWKTGSVATQLKQHLTLWQWSRWGFKSSGYYAALHSNSYRHPEELQCLHLHSQKSKNYSPNNTASCDRRHEYSTQMKVHTYWSPHNINGAHLNCKPTGIPTQKTRYSGYKLWHILSFKSGHDQLSLNVDTS